MARGWVLVGRAADLAQLYGSLPDWIQKAIQAAMLFVASVIGGIVWKQFSTLPTELLIVMSMVFVCALVWAAVGVTRIVHVSKSAPILVDSASEERSSALLNTLTLLRQYRGEGRALQDAARDAATSARVPDRASIVLLQQITTDVDLWKGKVYDSVSHVNPHEAAYFANCSKDWTPHARMECFLERLDDVVERLQRRP